MTSEPGSFARATIVERKPQIIQQVLADQTYPDRIVRSLEDFKGEITGGVIQLLHEPAEDTDFWNAEAGAFAGKTWLELPWYFAESYFYRRLLEATGYFQDGPFRGQDPFYKSKQRAVIPDVAWFINTWEQFEAAQTGLPGGAGVFEALLHSCLWGNRADLSNYTVKEQVQAGLAASSERHLVLIDHTDQVEGLLAGGVNHVDFINDNVGKELLFDLALADHLLREGLVKEIRFNLKSRPFFVSDTMVVDAQASVQLLKHAAGFAGGLGSRLDRYIQQGKLRLVDHPFWTTCLMFRQMPPDLRTGLAAAELVIIKGDVNYRRILDDRHWPFTTPLEAVASYFPAPFVTLRTLKGEIMVGLQPGQAETLEASDPTWLINGKRGVIHFLNT